jgi:hypothetical protein
VEGRGLGRQLWNVTLAFAHDAEYRKLVIFVRASNTSAQTFYRHLGFKDCGRLARQVIIDGVADDEVLMELFSKIASSTDLIIAVLLLICIIIAVMPYVHAKSSNLWNLPEHALAYLEQADAIPHRAEGEAALLEDTGTAGPFASSRHRTRLLRRDD